MERGHGGPRGHSRGGFGGGGFGGGGFGGERKMFKVTCSECGQEAEVPFEPKGDRPVFCKDCYRKKKGF